MSLHYLLFISCALYFLNCIINLDCNQRVCGCVTQKMGVSVWSDKRNKKPLLLSLIFLKSLFTSQKVKNVVKVNVTRKLICIYFIFRNKLFENRCVNIIVIIIPAYIRPAPGHRLPLRVGRLGP